MSDVNAAAERPAANRQEFYADTPLGQMCRQRDEARDEVERLARENARLYDGISRVITAIYAVYEQTQSVMRKRRWKVPVAEKVGAPAKS